MAMLLFILNGSREQQPIINSHYLIALWGNRYTRCVHCARPKANNKRMHLCHFVRRLTFIANPNFN